MITIVSLIALIIITYLLSIRIYTNKSLQLELKWNKVNLIGCIKILMTTQLLLIFSFSILMIIIKLGLVSLYESKTQNTGIILIFEIISGVLFVPFIEEILFRGFLFNYLAKFKGLPTIIATSILFALVHGFSIALLHKFFLGIVLGFLFVRMNSIIYCMICHSINNLYAYIVSIFAKDILTGLFLNLSILIYCFLIILSFLFLLLILKSSKSGLCKPKLLTDSR